ncbi:MAG: hypothetical protein LBH64_03170 [Coriobacteriales bacterium]|jgi:hypothetical protein|nr:hypothetical protein [Coriobacteriales bacterium]
MHERPRGCLPLRQYGTQAHANNLKETVLLLKGRAPDDLLTFQIDTFARTRTDITKKWISDGMSIDPETFATYTDSIVPRELYDLLNEPCLTECRRVPATTLKSCPPRGG